MKKLPVLGLLVATMVVAVAAIQPAKSLVGSWVVTSKMGLTKVQINANGTIKAEIPSEKFVVGGKYKFSQNILKISDTSCNAAYWGSYKVVFHGKDTIWSEISQDSCLPRVASLDHGTWVRQH